MRAKQAGILRTILAQPGDWRTIGVPLAMITSQPDEELPSDASGTTAMPVDFEVM